MVNATFSCVELGNRFGHNIGSTMLMFLNDLCLMYIYTCFKNEWTATDKKNTCRHFLCLDTRRILIGVDRLSLSIRVVLPMDKTGRVRLVRWTSRENRFFCS
jgi:hypothetical protein